MGNSLAAALMAACTSRAAPSMLRFRSNWIVMLVPPSVLTEVSSDDAGNLGQPSFQRRGQ